MSLMNILGKKVILPTSDLMFRTSVSQNLDFLNQSQWWSIDQTRSFQFKKLQQLLKHASMTVPFYIRYFEKEKLRLEDFRSLDDLSMLPIITKELIREHNGDFVSNLYYNYKPVAQSSSGSTGQPFKYYTTKEAYSVHTATALRGWYWMGYRVGDRYIKISNTARTGIKKLQDIANRCKLIYLNAARHEDILSIVREIASCEDYYLRSYPTQLSLILKVAKESNVSFKKIKGINTTGSILHDDLRCDTESMFNCKVFDSYSCEGAAMVFECPTHDCYHSAMEYAITEVVRDESQIEDHNIGRLITTDLWNYAMPFIRYDTKDFVERSDVKCSCGREHLKVRKIIGRDSDILVSSKGVYITPHLVSIFFKQFDVEQFQILEEELDEIQIKIVSKHKDLTTLQNDIISLWYRRFGSSFRVSLLFVREIGVFGTGKHRYIVRDPKIKLN